MYVEQSFIYACSWFLGNISHVHVVERPIWVAADSYFLIHIWLLSIRKKCKIFLFLQASDAFWNSKITS